MHLVLTVAEERGLDKRQCSVVHSQAAHGVRAAVIQALNALDARGRGGLQGNGGLPADLEPEEGVGEGPEFGCAGRKVVPDLS